MAPHRKNRFWRLCRIYFRRLRITVWLILFVIVAAFVYLNQVGLPELVKRPLLEKLRAKGLEIEFSRLRLSWFRGIVAENVTFGSAEAPTGPQLRIEDVELQLNQKALVRLQFQIDSLWLHGGRLVWPLTQTNRAPRQIAVENIQTFLRFLPNDEWALDNFRATFAGAKIGLQGTVTHASAVRDWSFIHSPEPAPPGAWQTRLSRLADTLEEIRFSTPPELKLDIRGDARDPQSFSVRMMLSAPDAETPWGAVSAGHFAARLFPATNGGLSRAAFSLEALGARTRWASTTNLELKVHLTAAEGQSNLANAVVRLTAAQVHSRWAAGTNLQLTLQIAPVSGEKDRMNCDLALQADHAGGRWGSATNLALTARWLHSLTNPVPVSGEGRLQCERAWADWGEASGIRGHGRFNTLQSTFLSADSSWAWWAALEPYVLDWECQFEQLRSQGVLAREVTADGSWRAPELKVTKLQARLDEGKLDANAGLNVATRALQARLQSDCDPRKVSPVLTEDGRRWLEQFSWEQPPVLDSEAWVIVPAWTNRQPDWRAEVQPTLRLEGKFMIPGRGSYRQVQFNAAESHFTYSNMVWRLPDLTVSRPEGRIQASHRADDRTKDFYWRLSSNVDVNMARPLLDRSALRGLDLFAFTEPPVINAEVWGRSHEPERVGFRGRVALTNFTFRGESFSGVQTELQYTNRLLQFTGPRAQRGTERLSADALAADFTCERVYLTNGFSTADPQAIARAIGPQVGRAIEPYHFDQPPAVHAEGIIPMHNEEEADLRFQVEGGPFHWLRFNAPWVAGDIHWEGLRLSLTNVGAAFYGGTATGSAILDFRPKQGTDCQFALSITNTLLQGLMADLVARTNNLEGRLNGTLVVTKANSDVWQKPDGYGDFHLRDGSIWEIPLFGVFSPMLNGIVPGLGNSRASAATCSFAMTNGVLRSDDLEIRSTGMRLQYRGTLDLQGQVNARVEAGLLRDVWLVGPIVSTVLWPVTKMFEYRLAGSLDQLKTEPVYIVPRLVLFPFHPFRTLKELLPEEVPSSRTNAPPLKRP